MNELNTALPTHDEIALHAFLIWEKEGRQPGREQAYWLQAEALLRQTRQQKAEAAAKAARTWPPQSAAAPKLSTARAITPAAPKAVAPKAAAPKTTKLAAASRDVAVKPVSVAKPAARKANGSASARKALARN